MAHGKSDQMMPKSVDYMSNTSKGIKELLKFVRCMVRFKHTISDVLRTPEVHVNVHVCTNMHVVLCALFEVTVDMPYRELQSCFLASRVHGFWL